MFLYDYEDEDYLTPRRIDILSQQRIKTFVHFPWGIPNPYFGALSENGHLFTWGGNVGRLSVGETIVGGIPKLVEGELVNEKVVQVAIGGSEHTLAVTDKGQVFYWRAVNNDYNKWKYFHSPCRVTRVIGDRKAIAVACTDKESFVLLEDGQVYRWGRDVTPIDIDDFRDPVRVPGLEGKVIKQIACGFTHCLALTACGQIFTMGSNYNYQLGNDGIMFAHSFVASEFRNVVQIAAFENKSAAEFKDGTVLAWGGLPWNKLKEINGTISLTKCANIDEAFAPDAMWRALISRTVAQKLGVALNDAQTANVRIKVGGEQILAHKEFPQANFQRLQQTFGDEQTTDVCFKVDGKKIFAHRQVLAQSSSYFNVGPQPGWGEKQYLDVDGFSYDTINAFLIFAYMDKLETTRDWAKLLELTDYYVHDELSSL